MQNSEQNEIGGGTIKGKRMTKEERIELTKKLIKDFKVYRVYSEDSIVELTLNNILEMGYGHLAFTPQHLQPDGSPYPTSFAVCLRKPRDPLIVIYKDDYDSQLAFNHELHHVLYLEDYDNGEEVTLDTMTRAEIDADNYALSRPHKREDAERFLCRLRSVLAEIGDEAEPGERAMFEARVANYEKRLAGA